MDGHLDFLKKSIEFCGKFECPYWMSSGDRLPNSWIAGWDAESGPQMYAEDPVCMAGSCVIVPTGEGGQWSN